MYRAYNFRIFVLIVVCKNAFIAIDIIGVRYIASYVYLVSDSFYSFDWWKSHGDFVKYNLEQALQM